MSDLRSAAGRPRPAFVCVPGFADTARSWRPLVAALAPAAVTIVDLPGFGAPPARPPMSIPDLGELVTNLVLREFDDPVILVGHSLGAVIAVEAAHRLGTRCWGMASFEGNLTPADAYFSGQAADHHDPAGFKASFSTQIRSLVAAGRAPASYADAVEHAHAESMWLLGRAADTHGASGGFGLRYRTLPIRSVYLWASSTTPLETRRYLTEHSIPQHRLPIEHHWPWTVDAEAAAQALTTFSIGQH